MRGGEGEGEREKGDRRRRGEGGRGVSEERGVGVRTLEQSWEGKEGRRAEGREDRKHHSSLREDLMSSDPS